MDMFFPAFVALLFGYTLLIAAVTGRFKMLSAQEAKNQIAKALVEAGLPTSRYNFQEKQGGIILGVALRDKIELIKIKKKMTQDEVDYIKGMISTFGRRMS